MTRVSACDGRYLSFAQQKRAWEELNRYFGGTTPTPGPDPPEPGPGGFGNVVYYYQGERVDDMIVMEGIGERINYSTVPGAGGLAVLLPFITLHGEKEFVSLWSWIQIS